MLVIRPELAHDVDAVRLINELAFPEPTEARLVDVIRANGHETLSLVAVDGEAVVGHILFSPVHASPVLKWRSRLPFSAQAC